MNMKSLLAINVAFVTLVFSAPASAAPLLFNFSGPSGTAVFTLDSMPKPNSSSTFIGSDQFSFNNVAGIYGGIAGSASTISFGSGSIYSAFNVTAPNLGFTQFTGPTLYTGTRIAPIFSAGSFTLINPFFGNGTLNISAVAGAVPEPATWAMMMLGIGLIGATMRRRNKVTTRVQFA